VRAVASTSPPPFDRVHNHAAAELLELMTDDAYDALVSACDDANVRAAVRQLLVALVEACERKPKAPR
jgi:hypothetical protein